MTKKLDLTGHVYNKLTVIEESDRKVGGRVYWVCRCECGNITHVATNNLRNGHTKSCGCRKAELWDAVIRTHGMANRCPEYYLWKGMLSRCYNPSTKCYPRYGGRGIRVAQEWHDFERFYADVGPRPSPDHQLDRLENELGYGPDNFRWATRIEQCNNRRSNRILEVYGEEITLAEAGRKYGLLAGTIAARLRRGESPERAVRPLVDTRRE